MFVAKGSMDHELFFHWIQLFASQIKKFPVLLIVDNAAVHMSVQALEFALATGIIILALPPDTTAKLQVLDVAIFGPFKLALKHSRTKKAKKDTVSRNNMGIIALSALKEALKPDSIVHGFQKTGWLALVAPQICLLCV
jgi:hypothetical protein